MTDDPTAAPTPFPAVGAAAPSPGATLAAELDWLSAVLDCRLGRYLHLLDPADSAPEPPAPSLDAATDPYAEAVRAARLRPHERLVLALALAPHLRPQALDVFFIANSTYNRPFTEFGGFKSKQHPGFLPTGETALLVLAGADLPRPRRYQARLFATSRLAKARLVRLEAAEPGEPPQSGALVVPPEALARLLSGKPPRPHYRSDFPARRITTPLKWRELVVEPPVREQLFEIRDWLLHHRAILADPHLRRLFKPGYRALFYGPPGTGKTLAACLLGKVTRPRRPVYRVDLSLLVSKFIGETEKNLAHVFDVAEQQDWILLFDEADALFGKRSTGSTANDHYANQQVAYLLQRIEDYPGVILLASNLKGNLDEAFARRFQSVVHFPAPGPAERLLLWRQAFEPVLGPQGTLHYKELADSYKLTGGAILNVLRYCVLKHHAAPQAITDDDVRQGIRRELAKEGRTM